VNILLLGGTKFLGRYLVQSALERGHAVTMFNRGNWPSPFDEVEWIQGDRDGGLSALAGRRWDAVIDTCGYVPRVVAASVEQLRDQADHYTFISSISVYDAFEKIGMDESAPIGKLEDEKIEEVTGASYGPLKALCERAAEEKMPGKVLVIRPGLIVGPHDPTDRFTYWPHRIAQGGEVLVPDDLEQPVQYIDVRDLAAWTISIVESRNTGVYHATGPENTLSFGQFLEACRSTLNPDVRLQKVPESFLQQENVSYWMDMPLWIPDDMPGFVSVDCGKAIAAGLTFRSAATTIADTQVWNAAREAIRKWGAGLSPDREVELLAKWRASTGND